MMTTSLNKPTRYEQERIDAMRRLGCVACAHLGLTNINYLELHHLLSGGVRMGHWYSIFLCRGHHQGDWSSDQVELIPIHQRVAISDGRKAFIEAYPSERMLWERVQERLKLSKAWPVSKIVPRQVASS
jgi:Recombination enhancement, RecA-dependent nuclease